MKEKIFCATRKDEKKKTFELGSKKYVRKLFGNDATETVGIIWSE